MSRHSLEKTDGGEEGRERNSPCPSPVFYWSKFIPWETNFLLLQVASPGTLYAIPGARSITI